jgi:PAS domain S-box-containing protein
VRRNILKFLVLPLLVSIIVITILHIAITKYFIYKAKDDIRNILLSNKGFHQYIQKVLHPAVFDAMEHKYIAKDFYNPQVLSSSYIVRTMHGLYNEEREKGGMRPVYYKMAANNPRNPVNKADELEAKLIKLFNENPSVKEYEEVVTVKGEKYLYYAIPFLKNEKRCMRCHGNPEDAPIGLRKLYPQEGGFHEKFGEIRAIESMRMPIKREKYVALMITGSVGSGLFVIVLLFFFNTGLRQRVSEKTKSLEAEILEKETAQEKLKASEARFRNIFESMQDGVYQSDADGRFAMANPAAARILGYKSAEDVTGKSVFEHWENPTERGNFLEEIRDRKKVQSYIIKGKRTDGTPIVLEVTSRILEDEESNFIGIEGILRDITERKKAENELRDSRQRLNLHVEQTPLGVIEWTLDFKVNQWNSAAEKIFGYSRQEAIGKHKTELILPPNMREQADKMWADLISQKGGTRITNENKTKDGRIILCEWFNTPLVDESGQVIGAASLVLDVTEQKRSADMIANERERLAVTLRSIGDGVIVTDVHGNITLLNKIGEQLTGWSSEEAIGQPLIKVFNIIDETTRETCDNPVEKVIRTGMIVGLANHTALIKKDGTEIIIADSGAPIRDRDSRTIGVVLVFRDITAQYRMEQEMQKMQKLESLGLLAGGLAHDFNNLLTSIIGNVSLAKMLIGIDHKAFERLTEAEKAAQRATDLTYQLLTFAKGGAPIKKVASITEIVKEAVSFALSGSSVNCTYNIPANLWSTEVDKGQMSQVFNNLIINAIQAMPNGGTVHIGFENIPVAEKEVVPLNAGDYVRITFRDEGVGIPKQHISRIFEPYYTTKQTGNGLGLSTVFSILKRHDGYISIKSKVGVGTTFTIYIPALKDTDSSDSESVGGIKLGKGKILIMDDEPLIRNVATEIMSALGYEVGIAKDGKEAIEAYKKAQTEGKPFDLVIMDLTVPGGMGGKEAVAKLREFAPSAKVIVSSGYSVDPIMSEYKKYGFSGVINKPYNANQVSATISKILGTS